MGMALVERSASIYAPVPLIPQPAGEPDSGPDRHPWFHELKRLQALDGGARRHDHF